MASLNKRYIHAWLAHNKSEQVDLRSQIKYTQQQQQQALIHLQF